MSQQPDLDADLDAAREEEHIPAILAQYPLPAPYRHSVLGVGAKSRAYLVETDLEPRAPRVLKLYAEGHRTRRQIEAELSLMRLLDERGLPVVLPFERREGGRISDFPGRSGARHAVLMTRAAGEVVARLTPGQAWHVGRALARFHVVTRGLEDAPEIQAPAPADKMWRATHLELQRPLSRIGGLLDGGTAAGGFPGPVLEELRGLLRDLRELDARLAVLRPRIETGLCHGSFHFGNFSMDGDSVMLFDLEAQCVAYQVTDLAMLLCDIAQNIHLLRQQGRSDADPLLRERLDEAGRSGLALVAGYESERPLAEAERGCLLVHAPVVLAIHIGELIRPGGPASPASAARMAVFLEEYASWNRLRRELGWESLEPA